MTPHIQREKVIDTSLKMNGRNKNGRLIQVSTRITPHIGQELNGVSCCEYLTRQSFIDCNIVVNFDEFRQANDMEARRQIKFNDNLDIKHFDEDDCIDKEVEVDAQDKDDDIDDVSSVTESTFSRFSALSYQTIKQINASQPFELKPIAYEKYSPVKKQYEDTMKSAMEEYWDSLNVEERIAIANVEHNTKLNARTSELSEKEKNAIKHKKAIAYARESIRSLISR